MKRSTVIILITSLLALVNQSASAKNEVFTNAKKPKISLYNVTKNDKLRQERKTLSVNTIPSRYLGVWKGLGIQDDNVQWTMLIAITGGSPGKIVGTIAYPSLKCGGELTLRSTKSTYIELTENLTYGSCTDDGIVTLRAIDNNNLKYGWLKPYESSTASGHVNKI